MDTLSNSSRSSLGLVPDDILFGERSSSIGFLPDLRNRQDSSGLTQTFLRLSLEHRTSLSSDETTPSEGRSSLSSISSASTATTVREAAAGRLSDDPAASDAGSSRRTSQSSLRSADRLSIDSRTSLRSMERRSADSAALDVSRSITFGGLPATELQNHKAVRAAVGVTSAAVAQLLGDSLTHDGDGDLDTTTPEVILDQDDLQGLDVDLLDEDDDEEDQDSTDETSFACGDNFGRSSLSSDDNAIDFTNSEKFISMFEVREDGEGCEKPPEKLCAGMSVMSDSESGLASFYLGYTAAGDGDHSHTMCSETSNPFDAHHNMSSSGHYEEPSPVYINEQGEAVTDLAYCHPLDESASSAFGFNGSAGLLNMSEMFDGSDVDFKPATECLDMLAKDEEVFVKEHRFIEQGDVLFPDGNLSWRSSCFSSPDAAYTRISIGEFMALQSEALGSLDGASDVARPTFGSSNITTPPNNRKPVALLDASRRSSCQSCATVASDSSSHHHNVSRTELFDKSMDVSIVSTAGQCCVTGDACQSNQDDIVESTPTLSDSLGDHMSSPESDCTMTASDLEVCGSIESAKKPVGSSASRLPVVTPDVLSQQFSMDDVPQTATISRSQTAAKIPTMDIRKVTSAISMAAATKPAAELRKFIIDVSKGAKLSTSSDCESLVSSDIESEQVNRLILSAVKNRLSADSTTDDPLSSERDSDNPISESEITDNPTDPESSTRESGAAGDSSLASSTNSCFSWGASLPNGSRLVAAAAQVSASNTTGQRLSGSGIPVSNSRVSGGILAKKANRLESIREATIRSSRRSDSAFDVPPFLPSDLKHPDDRSTSDVFPASCHRSTVAAPSSDDEKCPDLVDAQQSEQNAALTIKPRMRDRFSGRSPNNQDATASLASNQEMSSDMQDAVSGRGTPVLAVSCHKTARLKNGCTRTANRKSDQGQDVSADQKTGHPLVENLSQVMMAGKKEKAENSSTCQLGNRTVDDNKLNSRPSSDGFDDNTPLNPTNGQKVTDKKWNNRATDSAVSFSAFSTDQTRRAGDGVADIPASNSLSQRTTEVGASVAAAVDSKQSSDSSKRRSKLRVGDVGPSYSGNSRDGSSTFGSPRPSLAARPSLRPHSENSVDRSHFSMLSMYKLSMGTLADTMATDSLMSMSLAGDTADVSAISGLGGSFSRFDFSHVVGSAGCGGAALSSHTIPNESTPVLASTNFRTILQTRQASQQSSVVEIPTMEIPAEIIANEVCCVGATMFIYLRLFNRDSFAVNVEVDIGPTSVNGRTFELAVYRPFTTTGDRVFRLESQSGCDLQIHFMPRYHGSHTASLFVSVTAVRRSTNYTTARDNYMPIGCTAVPALRSTVKLMVAAEQPIAKITMPEGRDLLQFGRLAYGRSKAMSVLLTNESRAQFPVKLVISSSPENIGRFSFVHYDPDTTWRPDEAERRLNVCQCVLPPAGADHPLAVVVLFQAPPLPANRLENMQPEVFRACVDVVLDLNGCNLHFGTVFVQCTVGTVRLHTNVEELTFYVEAGRSGEVHLPLRNAGSLGLDVLLAPSQHTDVFSVTPGHIVIEPGYQTDAVVRFSAPTTMNAAVFECALLMYVEPDGPEYEIPMIGRVQQSRPAASVSSGGSSGNIPALLSNKHYIAFGGVPVGCKTAQQTVVLKNNSQRALQVRLEIRDKAARSDYQLIINYENSELRVTSREVVLKPSEELPVIVRLSPSRVACIDARLRVQIVGTYLKHVIPLSGYGGVSRVVLDGLPSLQDSVYHLTLDSTNGLGVTVNNQGPRAVHVKAIQFEDLSANVRSEKFIVTPSEFCLKSSASQVVRIVLRSSFAADDRQQVAFVMFLYGDEISRQKYRRCLQNTAVRQIEPQITNNVLRDVNFNTAYIGEEEIDEGLSNAAQSLEDATNFFANIQKLTVLIMKSLSTTRAQQQDRQLAATAVPSQQQPAALVQQQQRHQSSAMSSQPQSQLIDSAQNSDRTRITAPISYNSPPVRDGLRHRMSASNVSEDVSSPTQSADKQKRLEFRQTTVGQISDITFDIPNPKAFPLHWTVVDITAAYLQPSADVPSFRVLYGVFESSEKAGIVAANSTHTICFKFRPSEAGLYMQYWKLNLEPASAPPSSLKLELYGTGTVEQMPSTLSDTASLSRTGTSRNMIIVAKELVFPASSVLRWSVAKLMLQNRTRTDVNIIVEQPAAPFFVSVRNMNVQSRHYVNLPVECRPAGWGTYSSVLKLSADNGQQLTVQLRASFCANTPV